MPWCCGVSIDNILTKNKYELGNCSTEAGCDCVKFQKSCLSAKFTKSALQRKYDGPNSWGKTYGEHKAFLEFSMEQYKDIQEFCKTLGIDFTASAMDVVSLHQMDSMNVPFIKIGSGDANNFPLLKQAAALQTPLVISTGMQTFETVDRIVQIMESANKRNFALMHCVSSYPTEPQNCELPRILWLKEKYPNIVIGYSGHEMGIEISTAAVLLGARIVERHFTLDRNQKGSDHKCSLEPLQMKNLVCGIKSLKHTLNSSTSLTITEIISLLDESADVRNALKCSTIEKIMMPCEMNCRDKLGKTLVAAKDLPKGHIISPADLCVKVSEPNGISAEYIDDVVGLQLTQSVSVDEPLFWDHMNNEM
ncbi:sialic acid synthase isoform X2 [Musca domestica]|uniref:Sialic acid synthase isoform X2 n=1 Tax=Musca domestica TaxID=7370 RepID=A0A9J7DLX9_MUSDO|nr:sialic acid synthase isoform X2 [Musca domestica]